MNGRRVITWFCVLSAVAGLSVIVARGAAGVDAPRRPARTPASATLEPRPGVALPTDLGFEDTRGAAVRLADQFRARQPVLLIMGYAACPNLCSLVLHGMLGAISKLESVQPGRDFRLLYVSLDPREPHALAAQKRAAIIARSGAAPDGVSYLRGREAAIEQLARAVGFHFVRDERTGQYLHPAVVIVLTPDARVGAYVHGVAPDPRALEAGLRGAERGVVSDGGLVGQVLRCFRFESAARQYGSAIRTYLRVGGAIVFLLLAALLGALLRADRRTRS